MTEVLFYFMFCHLCICSFGHFWYQYLDISTAISDVHVCVCVCLIPELHPAWHASLNHVRENMAAIRWIKNLRKICCSTSFASLPLLLLPQPILLLGLEQGRRRRPGGWGWSDWGGGTSSLWGSHRSCHSWEGRRGGGNPMRQREERQREGNASRHWESLYLHHSLSLFPLFHRWSIKNTRLSSPIHSLCAFEGCAHFFSLTFKHFELFSSHTMNCWSHSRIFFVFF